MIRVKYFWIILFLGAQIATLTGVQYGLLRYRQAAIRSEIKKAIKEGVPENQLVSFRFHKQEENWINLIWTKPKKEFRFNNQMYDVVERREEKDSIYFKCIHDVKESGLFQQIDKMTNKQTSKEKSIVIYWSKQVYSPQNGIANYIQKPDESLTKMKYPYQGIRFNSLSLSPPLPPPKVS